MKRSVTVLQCIGESRCTSHTQAALCRPAHKPRPRTPRPLRDELRRGEEACVVFHSLCSNPRARAPTASTSRAPATAPSPPALHAAPLSPRHVTLRPTSDSDLPAHVELQWVFLLCARASVRL